MKKGSLYIIFLFLCAVACTTEFDPHPFISRIVRDPRYLYITDTNMTIDTRHYQTDILSQEDYASELLSCLQHYKGHFRIVKESEGTDSRQRPFYSVIIADEQDSHKLEFGFRRITGKWELVNILFKGRSCLTEP